MQCPESDVLQSIVLRRVLYGSEDGEIAEPIAVEVGDRGRAVREVRLERGGLVVRVALLRFRVVVEEAHAEDGARLMANALDWAGRCGP